MTMKKCPECKSQLPEEIIFKSSIKCEFCGGKVINDAPIQYLFLAIVCIAGLIVYFGFPGGAGSAMFGKAVGGILALVAVAFFGVPYRVEEGTANKGIAEKYKKQYSESVEIDNRKVAENIRKYKEKQRLLRESKKWWQFWI